MSPFYDSLSGFYFRVSIDANNADNVDAVFRKVEGISMELETPLLHEDGQNPLHQKSPTYPNLKLNLGLSPIQSNLTKWCLNTLGNNNYGKIKSKVVNLKLLNDRKEFTFAWTIFDAYPASWKISGVDAQNNSIIIETLELAYSYFSVKSI